MDSSDQRRKRKRFLKQSYSPSYLPSARFLFAFLGFLSFLSLLSYTSPSTSAAFRPVLVVSSLSLLSSSTSRTVKSVREFGGFFSPMKIEGRVLFPDHVLVLVGGGGGDGFVKRIVKRSSLDRLECVYYGKIDGFVKRKNVLSVDEFDGFRSIVRCPIAPRNYSEVVHLKRVGGKNGILRERGRVSVRNQTVESWDNVAYAATRDGGNAVVFVKGLNLRPDRESNPSQFSCHFGLGDFDRSLRFPISTRAVTAAQEAVRCPLPESVIAGLDKGEGVRVTVGLRPRGGRGRGRVLVPSVAKIFDGGSGRKEAKFELCVCTMVWNQASAIREWIKYHSWLGVEKWFIYDNNSDDGIDEVVQELDLENYNVSRHVWPWIKTQEAGFSHCALRAKDECSWVSFMDVDEYYYFPYSNPGQDRFRALGFAPQGSLRALVANLSSSSSSIGEIRTSCHSFGPSGLKSPPSQGVTVGYTCRVQSPERHKSIIRPDALDATLLNVVHHFHLKEGFSYLNLPQSSAVINHYKYQVWEVFRAKFYRRVATYVADWQQNQNEGSRDRAPGLGTEAIEPPDWPQRFCEVWDTGLRDFVLANLADLSTGLLPWQMHSASSV
ncbi:glycosyltransferase family 92 protein RCOM_0530710-like [Salvia miltiorrhiza]|uniref:glycosyltransferase family 92 protein RCOM_0530710-like n=1 Tax=Salvia miltiorrhiza TaxID=226208 RepID=UPI0025ABB3A7|nr:glycosyltransferase family 92 protein RCOM_0530710-like [Salvia miltiorrhiza]